MSDVELNDRPTRRVLLAMVTDNPEVDEGWLTEQQIRGRAGLPPLRAYAALQLLVESGAVERVTSGDLAQVHFRLTGTGVVRAMMAAKWPGARLLVWWHRNRAGRRQDVR